MIFQSLLQLCQNGTSLALDKTTLITRETMGNNHSKLEKKCSAATMCRVLRTVHEKQFAFTHFCQDIMYFL